MKTNGQTTRHANGQASGQDMFDFDDLVRDDRLSSKIYTDPRIFDLEMAHIFGGTWVFVAHESQIAKPGDFITTTVGKQPIIVTRDKKGELHALFNRCTHRGVTVCREEAGNSNGFTCPYHGWAFNNDGTIAGVPYRAGYAEEFLSSADLDLAKVPGFDGYGGFLFVCLREPSESLAEFLGPMSTYVIDDLLDRAPEGEVVVSSGVHRYQYGGNWKLHADNGSDGYHPGFTHVSTLNAEGWQTPRSFGVADGYQLNDLAKVKTGRGDGEFDQVHLHTFRHGHCFHNTLPSQNRRSGPIHEEYLRRLAKRHGEKRAQEILSRPGISNSFMYPNLVLRITDNEHIRLLRPISVDLTEVHVWPLRYKGAPDEMGDGIAKYSDSHTSAFAIITTDDLDVFERAQEGMQANRPEWILIGRGLGREEKGAHPGELLSKGTSETGLRRQYGYWKEMMKAGA